MRSLLLLSYIAIGCGTIFSPVVTLAQTGSDAPPPQVNPVPAIPVEAFPLVQSTVKLLGQTSYQIESLMDITGEVSGRLFESQAQVETILEAPNKFKSEIAFISPDDSEGKKYQIVSDGDRVWIYNLATNQYSITDYQEFIESRNGLMLGTVSYFYTKTLNDINKSQTLANAVAKLPPDRLVRYFQRLTGIDLQTAVITDENIEGTAYKVYDLDSPSKGFELRTYVNPLRGDIERVNLSGNKDGLDLAVEEQILSQTIPQSLTADTFSFAVDEAEEVEETIAIEPF